MRVLAMPTKHHATKLYKPTKNILSLSSSQYQCSHPTRWTQANYLHFKPILVEWPQLAYGDDHYGAYLVALLLRHGCLKVRPRGQSLRSPDIEYISPYTSLGVPQNRSGKGLRNPNQTCPIDFHQKVIHHDPVEEYTIQCVSDHWYKQVYYFLYDFNTVGTWNGGILQVNTFHPGVLLHLRSQS